jgi:hypothetical protein
MSRDGDIGALHHGWLRPNGFWTADDADGADVTARTNVGGYDPGIAAGVSRRQLRVRLNNSYAMARMMEDRMLRPGANR